MTYRRAQWLAPALVGVSLAAGAQQATSEALFQRARSAQEAGRLSDAEKGYREYLRRYGPRAEALANLGALLARRESYGEAIRCYEQALKLDATLAPLHLNLGLAYFKQGQAAPAVREFDLFLKAAPGARQAMQLRAMALVEAERYPEAEQQYRALLPGDLSVTLGLSLSLLRQQKTIEARGVLEPVLAREDSAEVQFTLGQALLEDGRDDDALAAFQRAGRIKPDLPQLRLNIGAVYWRQRKTDQALSEWRTEQHAHPNSFEALYTLGTALALSEKDQPEAQELLRQALAQRPRNARANYQLARWLWRNSKSAESATLLDRATQADPEFREAFFLYGKVLQAQGRTADAQKAFARVKQLSERELSRQRDMFLEAQ